MLVVPSPYSGLRNQLDVFKSNPSCNNFCLFVEMLTVNFNSVAVFNRLTRQLNAKSLLSVDMIRTYYFIPLFLLFHSHYSYTRFHPLDLVVKLTHLVAVLPPRQSSQRRPQNEH